EIISVDSRQVYRGMDIGTGKDFVEYVTPDGRVPHHLIDIADPEQVYTLWNYQRDFYRVFDEIRGRRTLPVAVGGSGLYLEAVLKNYRIPTVPEDVGLRRSLALHSKAELDDRLKKLNPALYDQTDTSSKKRLVRAMEIALYAVEHEVQWGVDSPPVLKPFVIGVRWPRPVLQQRIKQRLTERLDQGMPAEARCLLEAGVTPERLEMFGLEYKYLNRFLQKRMSYDEMVTGLYRDICRFAKRQETYFRGMQRRGLSINWVENADVEQAVELVDQQLRG
ncbi:MAG: tRNA (adenosine(37)-N6)-dimethylallyltransferase MiaA, partial [bacterium]|nr:tRNA (adenosine(37)-N6)-dimethylallyltransferase MiaA [bacterium]